MRHALDRAANMKLHGDIIRRKPLLRAAYVSFYRRIVRELPGKGRVVELGSGGGFFKEMVPRAVSSDVVSGPGIDVVCSAADLPFPDRSVAGFAMLDVFHHLKQAGKALQEMERCLKPGGKVVMIEPWNTPVSRFLYRLLHPEPFDPAASWALPPGGRLTAANGALPWIVFVRDRDRMSRMVPRLSVTRIEPHVSPLYLFSGGLSGPALLPAWSAQPLSFLERLFSFTAPVTALFATIILTKRRTP